MVIDNNSFVEFSGRFVYEQNGSAGATDNCFVTGDPTLYVREVTGLAGGGWFVTQNGVWQSDDIGMNSPEVDWYQEHQPNLPCHWTTSQELYINGRTQDYSYTTNQLTFTISKTKIYSEVQTEDGSTYEGCEYYSNKTAYKKKCTPCGGCR